MQQNLPPYDYRYNRPPDSQSQTVRRSASNITLTEMQNLLLQNPNLLLRLEQDYIENVLYDLLFEVAIDVLWSIRSGNTTLEDLYQVKPFSAYYSLPIKTEEKKVRYNIGRPPLPSIPTSSLQNTTSSSSSTNQVTTSSSSSSHHNVNNKNIHCPVCNELVAAVRFAYHLEKDMNGGKRGTRKHYDYLRDETYERPRPKKEHIDPHPNSMIVKIKLRNGVPYGNTKRIGVTLEDFLAHQQKNMITAQNVSHGGNNGNSNGNNGTNNRIELDGIETVSTNMNEEYEEEEDGYTVDTSTVP